MSSAPLHHKPPPELLNATTVFSLLATVALLAAALALARALLPERAYANSIKKWTFVWLVFDALIHLCVAGPSRDLSRTGRRSGIEPEN